VTAINILKAICKGTVEKVREGEGGTIEGKRKREGGGGPIPHYFPTLTPDLAQLLKEEQ